jgi:hypothetical protein
MQVELIVSQEILDEYMMHFGSASKCPIATALKSLIKDDVDFFVGYDGIHLWNKEEKFTERFTSDDGFITFSGTRVPEVYKSGAGNPKFDTDGNVYSDLTPFRTFIGIPERYLALAIA